MFFCTCTPVRPISLDHELDWLLRLNNLCTTAVVLNRWKSIQLSSLDSKCTTSKDISPFPTDQTCFSSVKEQ